MIGSLQSCSWSRISKSRRTQPPSGSHSVNYSWSVEHLRLVLVTMEQLLRTLKLPDRQSLLIQVRSRCSYVRGCVSWQDVLRLQIVPIVFRKAFCIHVYLFLVQYYSRGPFRIRSASGLCCAHLQPHRQFLGHALALETLRKFFS